jgi:uncharacterized protein YceH (UPF0502 family)
MDTDVQQTNAPEQAALLSAKEARVLACLMEKELTVPDNYPLTLNSLTLACNQKSNREPVMHLAEGEVGHLAKELASRDLIRIEYGERVHRFEHMIRKAMSLDKPQQALLTIMLLRAPQTLNELKVRSKRMVEFESHGDLLLTLVSLNERDQAIMQHLPKGPGQREDRYTHLLCGKVEFAQAQSAQEFIPLGDQSKTSELEEKIQDLIARVEALETKMAE